MVWWPGGYDKDALRGWEAELVEVELDGAVSLHSVSSSMLSFCMGGEEGCCSVVSLFKIQKLEKIN